jgi:hypothetical protein
MGRRAFRRNDVIDQQSRSQTEPIPAATRNVHLDNATSGATFTRTVQQSPGQHSTSLDRPSARPHIPVPPPEKLRLIHPARGRTSVYDASMPQVSTLGDAHIGFEGFGQIGRYAWNLFRAFDSSGSAGGGHDRR